MEPKVSILIHPATEEDTPDVLELTSHIWDGDDYVPYVWAEWLADPLGCLLVAEIEGRVVGLAKLSQSTPKDWWMQGLRVHPEFEGLGIASRLHEACLGYWRELGGGAVRLATNIERYPVHHLCERTGFQKTGEYSYFQASALKDADPPFVPVSPNQAEQALALSLNSPSRSLTLGYVDLGWEWLPPRLEVFEKEIERGQALWWKDRQGLLLYRMDDDEEHDYRPLPVVEWIVCEPGELSSLMLDFRRLAGALGHFDAGYVAPVVSGLFAALGEAGFERKWDGSVYLFEKRDSL